MTFLDLSCRSMRFYDIPCVRFMLFTMSRTHWNKFGMYQMYIHVFNEGETTFCQIYQNEAWKAARIFCHFDCFCEGLDFRVTCKILYASYNGVVGT